MLTSHIDKFLSLLVYQHFEGNDYYALLIFASPQSLLGTQ